MQQVQSAALTKRQPEALPLDWILFLSIGTIWGSSFLLIAIGLDAFAPGLVTWLRIVFGASALWLVPAARAKTGLGGRSGSDRPRW